MFPCLRIESTKNDFPMNDAMTTMNAFSTAAVLVQQNPLFRFYKHCVIESLLIAKRHGLRELVRQRGRKFLLIVAGYYLVRDTILYVVIPLSIARGLL